MLSQQQAAAGSWLHQLWGRGGAGEGRHQVQPPAILLAGM